MENILKSIAKQANLDRVLFTPALKKIYFDMAVASGGATQFKHADSIRNGLSFIEKKAQESKHALLFCAAHELIHGLDILHKMATQLTPAVILAMRSGVPDELAETWNIHQVSGTGCLQFHTHTRQEAYDHLALAYYLFAEKKLKLPVLILHSRLQHDSMGNYKPHEGLNLGNPMTGFGGSRTGKKMSFEDALASMKKKKESVTLTSLYSKLIPILQEAYTTVGYEVPSSGLPYKGDLEEGNKAILSQIPAHDETQHNTISRLLCYRPFSLEALIPRLQKKKSIAVVEPQPSPGVTFPPFYGEICAALSNSFKGNILSITLPANVTTLTSSMIGKIEKIQSDTGKQSRFHLEG